MKWKWILPIGTLNIIAVYMAAVRLLVNFAILSPNELQYEVGNVDSVKTAIFQAQSQGIEMMRRSATTAAAFLSLALLLNFIAVYFVLNRKSS